MSKKSTAKKVGRAGDSTEQGGRKRRAMIAGGLVDQDADYTIENVVATVTLDFKEKIDLNIMLGSMPTLNTTQSDFPAS